MIRNVLKSLFFIFYGNVYCYIVRTQRFFFGKKFLISIAYHRVNDDLKDSVTVSIEQFERQIQTIRKKYRPISLADLLTGKYNKRTFKPYVLITFDDGYLDNYINAYPILKKHKVPAIFFVSTGYIDTEKGFEHDIKRLGKAIAMMKWEHLKRMHDNGYEIGSHTVNHVNCAQTSAEDLNSEFIKSKEAIKNHLGSDKIAFAYPFGKKNDFTESAREQVKKSDYVACMSAYGGCNDLDFDVYNIKRFGVSYKYSSSAFKAKLEGLC